MEHNHISFIDYNMDQQLILPMDMEVLIPERQLNRIVILTVDKMDLNLSLHYPGGGRPSNQPKILMKIILYAYAKGIYSSRAIAEQLKENIYFMRISGHKNPDFRTINHFRSERMKYVIYETFFSIVEC